MRALPALALSALALTVALAATRASGVTGPEVNVSRLPGAQSEPTVAIDPSNDQVLLAGSNNLAEGSMPVYSSTDGGVTWEVGTTSRPPESRNASCAGDPGLAIDARGNHPLSCQAASDSRRPASVGIEEN